MEHVVLVDAQDNELGTMEKLEAHRRAALHRAVSVLVFDSAGRILLQRRSPEKYHCPGLWANACCTHPRPGEDPAAAAGRRLGEEMGFTTDLEPLFRFVYRTEVGRGLVEHELDYVFRGRYDGPVRPDPAEVGAYRWVTLADLALEMEAAPESFAPWFRLIRENLQSRNLL